MKVDLKQQLENCLDELKELTRSCSTEKLAIIYQLLNEAPAAIKGKLLEEYLSFLYQGNGYLSRVVGKKNDGGADIVLSHPQTPLTTFMVIQSKNHQTPLTRKDVLSELTQFELEAAKHYQCNNYTLVSLNGFVRDCEIFAKSSMRMKDWSYLITLIQSFDPRNLENSLEEKRPKLELYAHNDYTYQELASGLQTHQRMAVVQATGTGKSFLILQLLLDYYHQSKIIIAPSHHILNDLKSKYIGSDHQTTFLTYQKLARLSLDEMNELKVDLIIFDEFHRLGADKWESSAYQFIQIQSSAKIVGFSATPIRFLDGERNMVEEFFENHQTTELTLTQAIAKHILPAPTYISSLYTLDHEMDRYQNRINASIQELSLKQQLLEELDVHRVNWMKTNGVEQLFKKHLPQSKENMKFIVFCEDIQHLNEVQADVFKWFKSALPYKTFYLYSIYSGCLNERAEMNRFKQNQQPNSLDLMFCVNKLNEGLHVNGVKGVVFLRTTTSPIIYYQQMGRALAVGNQEPLIFDLVNNFDHLNSFQFFQQLNESIESEKQYRQQLGIPYEMPNLMVTDYLQEAHSLFEHIESQLMSTWDVRYQELIHFYKKQGHADVPITYELNPALARWVFIQRQNYKKGKLSEGQIQRLNQLNFKWVKRVFTKGQPVEWEVRFQQLVDFKSLYHHTNVSTQQKEYSSLAIWVFNQRQKYRANKLDRDKIDQLNGIGFQWTLRQGTPKADFSWDDYIEAFQAYQSTEGHPLIPNGYLTDQGMCLGKWVINIRQAYKHHKLSSERVAQLTQLGFAWDVKEWVWEFRFQELLHYGKEKGTINTPIQIEGQIFKDCRSLKVPLSTWVQRQRLNYRQQTLEPHHLAKLEAAGFDFHYDERWNETYEEVKTYYLLTGLHFSGHSSNQSEYRHLIAWCQTQRTAYRKQTLSSYRIQKLNEIQFWK